MSDQGRLAPTLAIRGMQDGDGTWVHVISVLEAPECSVRSTQPDLTGDIGRVLALLAELPAGTPVRGRRLRADLTPVMDLYLSPGF